MLSGRPLLGALLISLAACAVPPPVAPSVLTLPKEDEPPPAAVGPAPRDLIACMEEARVAAMMAARPGQPYPVAAGCVNVIFENALSANFIVTRVLFVLDGKKLIDRAEAAGTRGPLATIPVFRVSLGPAAAGEHTLQVLVDLQGDGTGPTAYLQGYRFEVRSSHAFTLASTGGLEIRTVLHERNTPPLKLEERPAIRYVVTPRAPVAEPAVTAPPVSLPKLP
jgi:hypothetical protein